MVDITNKNKNTNGNDSQDITINELFDMADQSEQQLEEQEKFSENFSQLVDALSETDKELLPNDTVSAPTTQPAEPTLSGNQPADMPVVMAPSTAPTVPAEGQNTEVVDATQPTDVTQ